MNLWLLLLTMIAGPDENLWERANLAYREGHYIEAQAQYEALLKQGVRQGKLHYNLANTYFKTGQLGKSILHYHRARKYLPGDADVEANLALAEQLRVDPKIEGENEAFYQTFDNLARRVSYSGVFWLAAICILLGGLATLWVVARPRAGKAVRYVMVLGWLVGLLLTGLTFLQHKQITRHDFAVLIAPETSVLSGPSTKETVSFTIHEGIRCRILAETESWYRIGLANGYNGWVPRTAIEII